jgi:hypothetical protein
MEKKELPTVPSHPGGDDMEIWTSGGREMHDTRPTTVARFFQLSLVCLDRFRTVSKLSSVVKAVLVT